jgi:hypothetical protein
MSRFNCPEEFGDQKIIWSQINATAGIVSGMGEHGLANRLWGVAELVKQAVENGTRYARDEDECEHGWDATYPGTCPACARGKKLSQDQAMQELGFYDDPQIRVCLTHCQINVCRPGVREERENGQASCVWSSDPEQVAKVTVVQNISSR